MGFASFDDEQGYVHDFVLSSCDEVDESIGSDDDDDHDVNSNISSSSSLSSSPNSPFSCSTSSPSGKLPAAGDSLGDMSSLLQQLPIK